MISGSNDRVYFVCAEFKQINFLAFVWLQFKLKQGVPPERRPAFNSSEVSWLGESARFPKLRSQGSTVE